MITEMPQASGQLIHLIDDFFTKPKHGVSTPPQPKLPMMSKTSKTISWLAASESVNLRLAGLQHGILVHLTDAESGGLRAVAPDLGASPSSASTSGPAPRTLPPMR